MYSLKIRNFFKSFIFKISLVSAIIICGITVTFSTFLYSYTRNMFRTQIIQHEKQTLTNITDHLFFMQESIETIAQSIAISNEIQEKMRSTPETHFRELALKNDMCVLLSSFNTLKNYFEDILILTEDGHVYSSNRTEEPIDINTSEWFTNWKSKNQNSGYSLIHEYWNEQGHTKFRVISYILKFRNLKDLSQTLGYIVININLDHMEYILESDPPQKNASTYALYDGDQELILGTPLSIGIENIANIAEFSKTLPDKNIILKNQNLKDGWTIAVEINNNYLLSLQNPLLQFLLLMMLLLVIFVLLTLNIVILHFTKPIKELEKASQMVGTGNFNTHLDIHTGDEFELLGHAFNNMVINIQDLLKKSVAYEKENKEMQIQQLMLQINPHFIYNSLNSIVYMAYQHRDEDIVTYTNSFIALLQDTLKIDINNLFTTLKQELLLIENYITLQKIRYPNKFEVIYHIDEETINSSIPQVLLQPLVENAIYHGLVLKPKGCGKLWISIKKIDTQLKICIKDNGVGTKNVNELLTNTSTDKNTMRKIGIANVRNRIRHIYGEQNGKLTIRSAPGEGFEVTIFIPYECSAESTHSID